MIAFLLIIAIKTAASKWLTSPSSLIEHSYLSSMDNKYLTQERLLVYSQFGYFQRVCPPPSLEDSFIIESLEEAYTVQESKYFDNENYIERTQSIGILERIFSFIVSSPAQPPKMSQQTKPKEPLSKPGGKAPPGSVKSNIYEFYNNNYEFREVLSMNVQMKARPLIAILFVCIFFLVLFRFSKRSEKYSMKIPKSLSLFWFFATIQLYLELSWLSLEAQPKSYSKVLFLGLVPLEQVSNYVPEVLNLLLFLICLFYFFSLIFRFNEIFGQDDLQEPHSKQALLDKQKQQKGNDSKKGKQGGQGQNKPDTLAAALIGDIDSEDDFSLTGNATQPIMQVPHIKIQNMVDLYHFMIINLTVFITFLKLNLLLEGMLYVRVSNNPFISTIDNMEVFPLTPRYLALFSVSFFYQGEYIGKTQTDRTQFNFTRRCPYFIASLHTLILLMRRRYLFTVDDFIILVVFSTSLSLHLSLDQKAVQVKKVEATPDKKKPQVKNLLAKVAERVKGTDSSQKGEEQEDHGSSDFEDEEFSEASLFDDEDQSKFSLKKLANKELQDILFQQLREMSEEDQRKLFQYAGGNFELSNDMELIRKLKYLSQIKQQQDGNPQYQQPTTTQGGQGQQNQTAHKSATKAPSGRPNPRKRR